MWCVACRMRGDERPALTGYRTEFMTSAGQCSDVSLDSGNLASSAAVALLCVAL